MCRYTKNTNRERDTHMIEVDIEALHSQRDRNTYVLSALTERETHKCSQNRDARRERDINRERDTQT